MAMHLSTRQHNTSDRTACRSLQGREKRATQRENITRHSYLSGNPFRPNPIPTCPFIPSLQTVPNPHYRAMKVRDGMDSSKKTRKHQTARLNQESEASEHQCHAMPSHVMLHSPKNAHSQVPRSRSFVVKYTWYLLRS